MPLQQLAPNTFYFASAVNSLVVANAEGGALLVDTGLDEGHARKLLREVLALGLTPHAILNTHSHTDHHGGNAFLLGKFPSLPIYAPPSEAAIIRSPLLGAQGFYGAIPPTTWLTKFLVAPASPAREIAAGLQVLGGVEIELLPVAGHALEMYAVRIGDILYAADALFGPTALSKHPLTFCIDSAAQKASAAALARLEGIRTTLPAHGEPTENLTELVAHNLASYWAVTKAVQGALAQGATTTDALLSRACHHLNVRMTNVGAVVLNRAVVSAHLTEGINTGWAIATMRDQQLIFEPLGT